jgi:hypothetical protein
MAILSLQQKPNERVCDFMTRVTTQTARQGLGDAMIASLAIKGLRPELQEKVMPQNLGTLEEVRRAATLAERTVETLKMESVAAVQTVDIRNLTNTVSDHVITALTSKFGDMFRKSSQPEPHQQSSYGQERQSYQRPPARNDKPCRRCGGKACSSLETCVAKGIQCAFCNRWNHFTETCLIKKRQESNNRR